MAGSLLPQAKQTFTDNAGKPLNGGKIYTYAAGSLTPKATYQDAALTIANANPVIANARGEVTLFGSGAYRIILKDAAGNTIWDQDNIEAPGSVTSGAVGALTDALAATDGAGKVGFQQASSPRARTLQDKARESVSVDDFYLAGEATYGPAIQRAEDYLASRGGGRLAFPGVLYTTAQTIVKKSNVHWTGSGRNATVLKLANGANVDLVVGENFTALTGTNSLGGVNSFGIEHITLDGNKANNPSGGAGLKLYGHSFSLSKMAVRNCKGNGIYAEWSNSPNAPAVSTEADWWESSLFDVRSHENDGRGIDWRGPHDSAWSHVWSYFNQGDYNIYIAATGGPLYASNCHAYGSPATYQWYCLGRVILTNCVGEGGSVGQIYIGQGNSVIYGGEWFSVPAQTPSAKGIVIGGSLSGLDIITNVLNCNGGAIDLGSGPASSRIKITAYQASGTPRLGTIPTDGEFTFVCNGVSGYNIARFPGNETVTNLGLGAYDMRGGTNVFAIADGSGPSFAPASGGILYVENGALKFRNVRGTYTVVA